MLEAVDFVPVALVGSVDLLLVVAEVENVALLVCDDLIGAVCTPVLLDDLVYLSLEEQ